MSDESIISSQAPAAEVAIVEPLIEGSDVEEPVQSATEEDLVKESQEEGKGEAPTLDEWQRSQQAAAAYIESGRRSHKTRFDGSVAGPVQSGSGDMYIFQHGALQPAETRRGPERVVRDLVKIRAVYVAPLPYRQAQDLLDEKGVLVLAGPVHSGKWTTALQLLLAHHDNAIFELDPATNLDDHDLSTFESGRGYVIDTLASDQVAHLSTFTLNRLSNHLKKQCSRLVITVDSRAPLNRAALNDYIVFWNEAPDRVKMLETHLAWYLPDQDLRSKSLDLSRDKNVLKLLPDLPPGEIDHLAELLAKAACGTFPLEEALRRFAASARPQVAAWFETHPTMEEHTFMLSLAVFNGAKYQSVVDADKHLRSLLRPAPPSSEETTIDGTFVFGPIRSRWVREFCAHIVQGYDQTQFGQSPTERIELDNPAFQPAILDYVWREYDRSRGHIVDWLRDLGLQRDLEVRDRAAAAIGELSKYDFTYVWWAGLLPWAKHTNGRVRTASALAMGILTWEDEFVGQVLKLLHDWSTIRNNWRLCWTAAATYGGIGRLGYPDEALADLYTIAQMEDTRLFDVVSRSTVNLFQAGQELPDYSFKVLAALVEWTAAPKARTVAVTGLLIFLKLAREARVRVEPEGEEWPALLWLPQADRAARDNIILLWHRALNIRSVRKQASEIIHQWLLRSDTDSCFGAAIEQFIGDLAAQGTARENERLRFYLDRWASQSRENSALAARMLAALTSPA